MILKSDNGYIWHLVMQRQSGLLFLGGLQNFTGDAVLCMIKKHMGRPSSAVIPENVFRVCNMITKYYNLLLALDPQ